MKGVIAFAVLLLVAVAATPTETVDQVKGGFFPDDMICGVGSVLAALESVAYSVIRCLIESGDKMPQCVLADLPDALVSTVATAAIICGMSSGSWTDMVATIVEKFVQRLS
jgi:hypothetical protein